MRKLQKSFKTEINPTDEQKLKIRRTIGTCRYVYNFYLDQNRKRYEKGEKFMSGKSFSVWLENTTYTILTQKAMKRHGFTIHQEY